MANFEDEARGPEEKGQGGELGRQPPFEGRQPPFEGRQPPFEGRQPPFEGRQPPFEGRQPPFEGRQPPFEGRQPPFEGKHGTGGDPGGGRVFLGGSSREAGVVVRATVESFGPVGETELQVNIKWPAGCNSSPVVEPVKRTVKPPGGSVNVA